MKKILMFMLVLAMLGAASVMAQEVTAGVEATAAFNAISSHTDATVDSKFLPTTVSNPYGLSATGFVVAPWATLAWDDLVVNVSARADSMDYSEDDSIGNATLNIKKSDLFGYSGFALVAQVEQYGDDYSASGAMDNATNYFGFLFENDVVTAEVDWDSFSDLAIMGTKFERADLTFNDGNVEARVEVKNGVGGATQITENTYLKYNNLFGIWTMDVAGAGKTLRTATEATGSGLGEFNHNLFYFWDSGEAEAYNAAATPGTYKGTGSAVGDTYGDDSSLDVMNTFAVMDGLTVKLGTVAPTSSTTIKDWLRGDNLFVGAEYAMEGLGVFNVGFAPVVDYDFDSVTTDGSLRYSGSRSFYSTIAALDALIFKPDGSGAISGDLLAMLQGTPQVYDYASTKTGDLTYKSFSIGESIYDGTSFWLDTDLSSMMDPLTLAVSVDGQFSKYLDVDKWIKDSTAGMDGSVGHEFKPEFVSVSRFNLGFDAAYVVNDALSVTADATVAMVSGFDWKKATGSANTFKVDEATASPTDYYTSNYTVENFYLASILGDVQDFGGSIESPLTFNVGATYKLSDMLAFSVADGYTALAGALHYENSTKGTATGDNFGGANYPAANSKTMYGYYDKNKVELGAVVTPKENMTISLDIGYSMFLGMPAASDLYMTGLTAAEKNVIDVAFDKWIDKEFNPWSASVAYSYSY